MARALVCLLMGSLAFGMAGCSNKDDGSLPPGAPPDSGVTGSPDDVADQMRKGIGKQSTSAPQNAAHGLKANKKTRLSTPTPAPTPAAVQQMLDNIVWSFNNLSPGQIAHALNCTLYMTTDEFEAFLQTLTPEQSAQLWQTATPDKMQAILQQMSPTDQSAWQGYWSRLQNGGLVPYSIN